MDKTEFARHIFHQFPYPPTEGQKRVIWEISKFIYRKSEKPTFLLKGYAGTGKTTLVSTFVNHLHLSGHRHVLLAPTGRAAKVLSGYSGKPSFTIHKKIYIILTGNDGTVRLSLGPNKYINAVFFVDEASMIPDSSAMDSGMFSGYNLLENLIEYVFSGENNKLILIGDTAQLPPVGIEISPALDPEYLKNNFVLSLSTYELQEVVRQSADSGILTNATRIRNNLDFEGELKFIDAEGFSDIHAINGELLEDKLINAFQGNNLQNSVVITRSNKRANIFNQEIRNRVLFRENEISVGDYLMVVKNNYYWVDKKSGAGFIANGDIIEVIRINKHHELYGYRFLEASIRLTDYPDENDLSVILFIDTLNHDGPSLTQEEQRKLFEEVMKDYEDTPLWRDRTELVKNNPFYNALQVKFAYALTCHKTQGGQWENVFIDLGYLTEEHMDNSFYRWLYTAFTRATKNLFLINFPEGFFIKN
ncbi:MAG: AAA family ATPase [Bacteroidales bacterium]|nr:AAA family ATPase [Bacteroidales bacterium]MCF8403939.1 AAA family ATPase [Bacteroidales bacterium]